MAVSDALPVNRHVSRTGHNNGRCDVRQAPAEFSHTCIGNARELTRLAYSASRGKASSSWSPRRLGRLVFELIADVVLASLCLEDYCSINRPFSSTPLSNSLLFLFLHLFFCSWFPGEVLAVAVFVVVVVAAHHAPAVVAAMVRRRCLPPLPWRRDSGAMILFCVFVAKVPIASFFPLIFLPLSLNAAWMACFCTFRGAVDLLLMLT